MNRKTVAGCAARVAKVYRLPCRSENAGIAFFDPLEDGAAPARIGERQATNSATNVVRVITAQHFARRIDLIVIIPASTFSCTL
jgi:hypothetical protein